LDWFKASGPKHIPEWIHLHDQSAIAFGPSNGEVAVSELLHALRGLVLVGRAEGFIKGLPTGRQLEQSSYVQKHTMTKLPGHQKNFT